VLRTWLSRDETPVLLGPRVTLRAARPGDYDEWAELRRKSREFLKPYEPRWTESDLSRRVYLSRLKRGREEARQGTDYGFLVFLRTTDSETLVGGITLSNIRRRAAQYVTLGYWMGQEHVGQGLMTEAVGVVIPFAFDTLGLTTLELKVREPES